MPPSLKRWCLLSLAALALTAGCSSRGGSREFVTDRASVLEVATSENITRRLEEFEKETCHSLYVLVIPSLGGKDFAGYTATVMKERQIAPPPLESGLLLTVAIEEGKARIDAGKGLLSIVNSGRADEILRTGAFPFFAEKRYDEGIVRALVLLMDEGRLISYPDELRPGYCR